MQVIYNCCKRLGRSFLHLVYPSHCLHCRTFLSPEPIVLCSHCSSSLELLDPEERCPVCFHVFDGEGKLCQLCVRYPSLYTGVGSCFSYEGAAATLVRQLKYYNQTYLSRGMGAFLVTQWERLRWPIPDVIVPVPISFLRWVERKYNQSELLAQEVGRFLHCPMQNALRRKSGDYQQASLSLEQRRQMRDDRFSLRPSVSLKDKVVLVIDDVVTSGYTLHRCAQAIQEQEPSAIYALTFCKTGL